MSSLKDSFKTVAQTAQTAAQWGSLSQPGFQSPFSNNQDQTPKHEESLLTSLTSGKTSFKVNATATVNPNTTINNNVGAQANIAKQSAQSVQAQTQCVKGQITSTIQEAQRQVHVAMKETGNAGSAVFMNTASAQSDVATAVTSTTSGITQLLDACSDLRNTKDSQKIIAEISDALRAKSSSPSSNSLKGPGEETPQIVDTGIDWNHFLEQHDLEELMAIDPEDPHQLPEWQELDNIEHTAKQTLAQSQIAKNEADTDITVDPEYYCSLTQNYLDAIEACRFENLIPDETVAKVLKAPEAENIMQAPQNVIQQTMTV